MSNRQRHRALAKSSRPAVPAERVERSVTLTAERYSAFSGPLPDPDTLREYQQIIPDIADRLLTGIEQEREHRHDMEELALQAEIDRRKRGQRNGLIIGIAGLAVAALGIHEGHPVAASIIGSFDLVALVAVFVHSPSAFRRRTKDGSETPREPGLTNKPPT